MMQRMGPYVSLLSFSLSVVVLLPFAAGAGGSAVANATTKYGSENFYFTAFVDSFRFSNLSVLGAATVDNVHDALQLTPDTANQQSLLVNQSGRVLFSHPFRLWAPAASAYATPYVASFSTVFTINVYSVNQSAPAGEGLAFLIAPSLDGPPAGSFGGFLGLSNTTTDGKVNGSFVAVELDTLKQDYDIDGNHVGLDINSVHSVAAESLNASGISIVVDNSTFYNVWIDYSGAQRSISVYMAQNTTPSRPAAPVLTSPLDLSTVLPETVYLGFAASTGVNYELNCVLGWNFTVEILPGGNTSLNLGLIVGISVAAATVVALAAAIVACVVVRRRRRRGLLTDDDPDLLRASRELQYRELVGSLPGTPKEFKYRELEKATNNFDERRKLGEGGFGVVYRGTLPAGVNGEPIEVAVKMFTRASTKGLKDFVDELSVINRLRHRNLVSVVGWSHKNGALLIVYDYLVNGSLDRHLFSPPGTPILPWERRYHIVAGVASALNYLHHEYDEKVIHRDIKPSNIMLDAAFNAHLGDFGLARVVEPEKTSYTELQTGLPGTFGYIAPECFHTGRATCESDVFAFGVAVLVIVTGRNVNMGADAGNDGGQGNLVNWVWKHYGEGSLLDTVDRRLEDDFPPDDAKRLILLGLACSNPNPRQRPKMPEITQILSRALPPPAVPAVRPVFMWPVEPGSGDEGQTIYSGTPYSPALLSFDISMDDTGVSIGPPGPQSR